LHSIQIILSKLVNAVEHWLNFEIFAPFSRGAHSDRYVSLAFVASLANQENLVFQHFRPESALPVFEESKRV
jgi:hypothetical protein